MPFSTALFQISRPDVVNHGIKKDMSETNKRDSWLPTTGSNGANFPHFYFYSYSFSATSALTFSTSIFYSVTAPTLTFVLNFPIPLLVLLPNYFTTSSPLTLTPTSISKSPILVLASTPRPLLALSLYSQFFVDRLPLLYKFSL